MKTVSRFANLSNRSGFTLVELLIVVIILAVLAAIVVPQFSTSTEEAREAALRTTLLEMRNAVELYYHQHNSEYPGRMNILGTADTSTDAEAQAAFLEQLTLYSDINGQTDSTRDLTATPPIRFGPYLKRASLPISPIDESDSVTLIISGATLGDLNEPSVAPAATDNGWWFDVESGKFIAFTDNQASDGSNFYEW